MNRYKQFSLKLNDGAGNEYLSGLSFVDFIYQGRVLFHTVDNTEEGRPDLIAYKYLSDASLWPIILWFNGIIDPLLELHTAAEIKIPVDFTNQVDDIKAFAYR